MLNRLNKEFFLQDALQVAAQLLGMTLVRKYTGGDIKRFIITETEAYRGTADMACHASKGRTPRTDVMFREGGLVYVYFVYGMYWMLNFVTGPAEDASAVLIRGLDETKGPGRIGRILELDRSLYGENLSTSQQLWIEDLRRGQVQYTTHPRVGIQYAGEPWVSKPWRFCMTP